MLRMMEDDEEPLTIYRLSKIIFAGPILVAALGSTALWYAWTSNLYLLHNLGPMLIGLERYEVLYPTLFLDQPNLDGDRRDGPSYARAHSLGPL